MLASTAGSCCAIAARGSAASVTRLVLRAEEIDILENGFRSRREERIKVNAEEARGDQPNKAER